MRSMTVERVRNLHGARPFRPFTIHLGDGRSFRVKHPELLAILPPGRNVIVVTGEDEWEIIDLLLVTSIGSANGATRRPRRRR
jgi:hypothetical protein